MAGPFAEKLGKAVAGRKFPKVTPDAAAVAAGLDLSGGGKSGREKGRAKHEQLERERQRTGAGVSGRAVHTRGQFVEQTSVVVSSEQVEQESQHQMIVSLIGQINETDERLQKLFQEYPESVPTIIEVQEGGVESAVDVRTMANEAFAAAGRDALEYETADGEVSAEDLKKLVTNFSDRLAEMVEAEDHFRKTVNLPQIERAHPDTEQTSTLPEGEPDANGESGEGGENAEASALFQQKLDSLEERMGSWMEIRRQILEQGDPERLNADLKGLEVRDLAKKRVLESVTAEIAMHRQSLAKGQKPDGEAQAWLDRHLAGLDEILSAGVAIREQILKERALEAERTKQAPENEENSGVLLRSYASFDYQERQKIWREMRGKPMEKVTTVIDQLEHWKRFDDLIRQFHNESRFKADLINRDLGEKYAQVLALTGRNDEVAARLKKIKKQVETDGELNEKDAGFLTAMFFDYHELLVVGEQLMQERDRETPMIEAEKAAQTKRLAEEESVRNKAAQAVAQTAGAAVAAGEKSGESLPASFEGQLNKLTGLVGRWNALGAELGWPILYKALRKERKEKIPPVKDLEDWLAKKSVPGAWDGKAGLQDRGYVEREVLPDMKKLIRQAEAAAVKWRAQQELAGAATPLANEPIPLPLEEPSGATVIGLNRRVLERDETGELMRTEWERMNPVEQNRIRRTLFEKRNEYLTRANLLLKKNGLDRAVDRQKMIRERLEIFMAKVIERDIVGVKLTDSDRESLMRELEKETEAFFAQ